MKDQDLNDATQQSARAFIQQLRTARAEIVSMVFETKKAGILGGSAAEMTWKTLTIETLEFILADLQEMFDTGRTFSGKEMTLEALADLQEQITFMKAEIKQRKKVQQ